MIRNLLFISLLLASISHSHAQSGGRPVGKKVNLDYGSLSTGLGTGIVIGNIKTNFDYMVDNMTEYVANRYWEGGSAQKRLEFARILVNGVMQGWTNANIGKQDISWMLREPFADDLRLFKKIRDGNLAPFISDSPDVAIPYRIETNYPLLLANGQRNPTVLSDTKSIRIK